MEQTGNAFFKRKRMCTKFVTFEDEFSWILAKTKTSYFLYWAGMIFYIHLLVCNGCVLQYFIIGHHMMIGADLYYVYLGRKQWLVGWIKIPKDVDV